MATNQPSAAKFQSASDMIDVTERSLGVTLHPEQEASLARSIAHQDNWRAVMADLMDVFGPIAKQGTLFEARK